MSAPSDLPDTHTAAATTLPADDDPLTTAGTRHDTLSPTERVQRRDSLERHLQHRPDARHLKEKGILMDTSAAPGLQAAQRDLEMQQASDRLRRGLEGRSARGDLEERNILPPNSQNVAPSLQQSQMELQKRMRKDSLDKQLKGRPRAEDLVKEGILKEGDADADAAAGEGAAK